jgi:hypothetical protein
MIRVEGLQWIRAPGEEWVRTDANPVIGPSAWGEDYDGAVGHRIAGEQTIGDRKATLVLFFVPGDRFASAWYGWWVDNESGRLLREVMVSRGHYMIRDFDAFDAAPPLVAPE